MDCTLHTGTLILRFVDSKQIFESEDLFFQEILVADKEKKAVHIRIELGIKMDSPLYSTVLQYLIQNKGEIIYGEEGGNKFKIGGHEHHVEIHPYGRNDYFIDGKPTKSGPVAFAVYKSDKFMDIYTGE